MNTNTIPYWETLVEWDAKLAGAPSGLLVFALCIAAGYAWKSVKLLPNRVIPLVVMLTGAILHPILSGGDVARTAVIGFVIGFLAWLFHRLILKRIEDRLGVKLTEDETDFIAKPPTDNYDPKNP